MGIKINADNITDFEVTWYKLSDIEPVFEKGYPSYEAVNKEHLEKIKKLILDESNEK
tara:strand:- start:269 stop:439 length:171 start_codon:yes stop_codon:yes gene_type:complete